MSEQRERKQWVILAEERLHPEDQIEKAYCVHCDGRYGYLILSNRKLMFILEKGFFRKHYEVLVELPYKHISDVIVIGKIKLLIETVYETKDETHIVEFDPISIIKQSLDELKAGLPFEMLKVAPVAA